VICSAGRPGERPNPKKPTALRGVVGVWNCESSDRIKGCDGARIHAVGSLAGANGWGVTNIAAFSIFQRKIFQSVSHIARAHLADAHRFMLVPAFTALPQE
jgi:hypothetical protein